MTSRVGLSHYVPRILDRLACPQCRGELAWEEGFFLCGSCGTSYPTNGEIADLRPPTHRAGADAVSWSEHWSVDNQESLIQRFFSFYRKAVFSRTVRYFVGRYFSPNGVFVEAGSGTSETSMRIDKRGGARTLVAIDIVLPVLERCHPIMDVRVGGDIFHLPFRGNSIEGVWNVGVMEHFTHDQIDQIMQEFHRVLRPGGPLILLWPGTDSVPQKLLSIVEKVINLRNGRERFRFHHIPHEISQLRSTREGRKVLTRNGFDTLDTDYGFRSLLAFKALVGVKSG